MTDENRKRRRWLQFRLRTLLIGVLVLSLSLSWYAARVTQIQRQNRAIDSLWEHSCFVPPAEDDPAPVVSFLWRCFGQDLFYEPTFVWAMEGRACDSDLRYLHEFRNPDKIDTVLLQDTRVTDMGLTQLESLAGLQKLGLNGTQITDSGLGHLKGLVNLQELFLADTQITDVGLEHLKGLTGLEKLVLDDTQVTDTGLDQLKGLTNLKVLFLDNPSYLRRRKQAPERTSQLPNQVLSQFASPIGSRLKNYFPRPTSTMCSVRSPGVVTVTSAS